MLFFHFTSDVSTLMKNWYILLWDRWFCLPHIDTDKKQVAKEMHQLEHCSWRNVSLFFLQCFHCIIKHYIILLFTSSYFVCYIYDENMSSFKYLCSLRKHFPGIVAVTFHFVLAVHKLCIKDCVASLHLLCSHITSTDYLYILWANCFYRLLLEFNV